MRADDDGAEEHPVGAEADQAKAEQPSDSTMLLLVQNFVRSGGSGGVAAAEHGDANDECGECVAAEDECPGGP